MSTTYKCNRVLIKVENDKIGVVEGFGLEAIKLGGIEPNFKTNTGKHVIGSEVVSFTLRRWMYVDPNQKRLLYDLWKNKTKFMLYFGIHKEEDNTSFLEEYLLVRNCIVYKWRPIFGAANDIVGEEITGEGYPIDWNVIELEEGDFDSWAIYDSFDETDTVDSSVGYGQLAIFNRLETIAILIGINDYKMKRYTISSKTVSGLLTAKPSWTRIAPYEYKSAYGTYVVTTDTSSLWIFKDGAIIQTLTFTDLGFTDFKMETVHISPTGKYIAIGGQLSGSGNDGWVILVGT